MRRQLLFIFLFSSALGVFGQVTKEPARSEKEVKATEKTDSTKKEPSYFKAEISYLSNSVYNGRKDSIVVPYVTAQLGYYDNSGLYITSSLSYLANSTGRIDLVTVEGGYDFAIGKNFTGELYASKYYYNKNSTAVTSQIKGMLGSSLSYDAGFLSFGGGIDLAFSQQSDIIVNYTVSHPFRFGSDSSIWTIEPSFKSNFGTQKYYEAQKKAKKNGGSATKITGSTAFVVLDYEFSLPLSYDTKKWGFSFTPSFAIPVNPISLTKPNGSIFLQEKLSNVFYAELGFNIKF